MAARTGRPPEWLPEQLPEFEEAVEAYFQDADEKEQPYTTNGLALALGFADRYSVWEYSKKDAFAHTVKKAMARIEAQHVSSLLEGKRNPAGTIFVLKNCFNWRDTHNIEQTVEVQHSLAPATLTEIRAVLQREGLQSAIDVTPLPSGEADEGDNE